MLWQDAADIAFKYPSKIFGVFLAAGSGVLRRCAAPALRHIARLASHFLPFAKKFTFFFVRVLCSRQYSHLQTGVITDAFQPRSDFTLRPAGRYRLCRRRSAGDCSPGHALVKGSRDRPQPVSVCQSTGTKTATAFASQRRHYAGTIAGGFAAGTRTAGQQPGRSTGNHAADPSPRAAGFL